MGEEFLTSFLVMLMLLVPGPHSESHCLSTCPFLPSLCPDSLPSKLILPKRSPFFSLASLWSMTQALQWSPGSRCKVEILPSCLLSPTLPISGFDGLLWSHYTAWCIENFHFSSISSFVWCTSYQNLQLALRTNPAWFFAPVVNWARHSNAQRQDTSQVKVPSSYFLLPTFLFNDIDKMTLFLDL